MEFNITSIVEIIAALIGAIILYILVPYVKSKTTDSQQDNINKWVRIAVQAAEQIYDGEGRGAEKKDYVLEFLADKGLKIDSNSVDALIEAAVLALNKGLF